MPNVFCYITEDGTLFVGTFEGYSVIYSKRFKEPQLKEVYSEKKSFYEGIYAENNFKLLERFSSDHCTAPTGKTKQKANRQIEAVE